MKRVVTFWAIVCSLLAASIAPALAEVKTKDKSQVKFEGMLGRMMGMFGGKAAKEGVVSTNAVKGDRKATINESTGRIVDLAEEKVYDLDMNKKTYQVTTFEELRRRLREAQEQAQKDAEKAQKENKEPAPQQSGKEVEVDFDVKETGQKKAIAGFDAREVVMTITVREKGKTLEESGGLVITSDSWLGPEIPAMKELAEFELRYWKAIAPETAGISPEQMAAAMAMYPLLKPAMERLNREKAALTGTPLSSVTTFDAVKGKEQMEQEGKNSGGGGLSGMLARKMMKKDDKPRATIFTLTNDVLEIGQTVAADDLQVPAGFKLKS